jgi:hypothetical protein
MPNMSYCRFQNTLQDLRDCLNHLCDDDLSKDEKYARESLAKLCEKYASDFESYLDNDEENDEMLDNELDTANEV